MKKSIIAIIIALCAIAAVVIVLVVVTGKKGSGSNGAFSNTNVEELDTDDEFVVELEEGWEGEMR